MNFDSRDETFLARWLNNELTEEELRAFEESEDFTAYRKLREASENLEIDQPDMETMLANVKQHRSDRMVPKDKRSNAWTYGIAASIVLALGFMLYVVLSPSETRQVSDFGQQTLIELPDGSEVVLNARAEILYNEGTWSDARTVSLNGEAFFNVSTGSSFTVNTPHGSVTVLGTAFNIRSGSSYFEVVCYQGRVRVTSEKKESVLTAGRGIKSSLVQELEGFQHDLSAPSWLQGESDFQKVPVDYVLSTMEWQYDVEFIGGPPWDQQTFTGSFPHDDLNIALESVLSTLQVTYQIEGKRVILSE